MTGDTLLQVRDLGVVYDTRDFRIRALDGVSFSLQSGETLAVVGESGCGKSTLGHSLLGLLPSNAQMKGEIIFDGMDITKMSRSELRKIRWEKIAIVFQNAQNALDPTIRVGDQVVEVIRAHRRVSYSEARDTVKGLFELVGLPADYYRNYPHELSGGSRQRVMIAMALSLNPKLLIADEPTTGLDVSVQLQILNLLRDLKAKFGMSMIFITHDIGVAKYISDRMAVMYAGQIVELASSESLITKPLHPYTMALIDSLIDLDNKKKKQPIQGFPPDLSKPIIGCRFAERCRFAVDQCKTTEPPYMNVDGRLSKCFFTQEIVRRRGMHDSGRNH